VLAAHGWLPRLDEEVDLSKHELLESFSREQVERLTSHLERRELRAREIVVRTGDPADSLYLLVRGDLSVSSDTTSGRLSRLSTLPPGKGFGEQFLVEGAVRGAFVRADTPAVCWTLSAEAFHKAASEDPDLGLKLLQNLLASTSRIMQRLTSDALTAAD